MLDKKHGWGEHDSGGDTDVTGIAQMEKTLWRTALEIMEGYGWDWHNGNGDTGDGTNGGYGGDVVTTVDVPGQA